MEHLSRLIDLSEDRARGCLPSRRVLSQGSGSQYWQNLWLSLSGDFDIPLFSERAGLARAVGTAGSRVLDFGCGDGRLSAELATAGVELSCLDVAPEPLRRTGERIRDANLVLHTPGEPVQLDDASIDAVFCSEVLNQVEDLQLTVSEIRRLLSPGGLLALTVPYNGRVKLIGESLFRFQHAFDPWQPFARRFNAKALAGVLADLGFTEVKVWPVGGPPLMRRCLFALALRP